MVVGVTLASLAGLEREKLQGGGTAEGKNRRGGFLVGLVMVVVAGFLSTGWGFAFTYSQDPIVHAMQRHGAGYFPATIAVWAVALLGAAVPNVLYPAWLMTRNRSWHVLALHPAEIGLSLLYGVLFFLPSALLGNRDAQDGRHGGLGRLGHRARDADSRRAGLGFISGEWRGVHGRPRAYIYAAIMVLVAAMVILARAKGG